MKLIIDISKKPKLILKDKGQIKAVDSWPGMHQLAETLLSRLDSLLKKNNLNLKMIDQIDVVPSSQSQASTKVAEATALALKLRIE